MGYDLHIHRAENWTDADRQPITPAEWLAVIASDPELRLDPDNELTALWSGPCKYPDGTWFAWEEGRIHTKNPDRPTVLRMLQLAHVLGARVQGDDGEFYNRPEDVPSEEEMAAARARPSRWLLLGCALAGLSLLFVFGVGAVTICRSVWLRLYNPP